MKKLFILRGLPGSGKSTLAATLGQRFEADDYFTDPLGHYDWNPRRVADAHLDCKMRVERAMRQEHGPLVVSNTFVKGSYMQEYLDMAKRYGYTTDVIDLFDGGLDDQALFRRNVHGVPLSTIERMRRSYER